MAVTSASCSLVVATRYRARQLDTCLSAVAALDDAPAEVIVVDNSEGHPETVRVANERGARYLLASDTGLSGARNAGAQSAKGEIVAFLDDDAVPQEGWLSALCRPFADRAVMAVTGRIMPLELESPAQRRFAAMGWLDLGTERIIFDRQTVDWFEKANFGGVGLGGNMAFRRSVFETWPGFRESFGLGATLPGGEENYAFFELIRSGHAVAYEPEAIVTHPYPDTFPALRYRQRLLLGQALAYAAILFAEEPEYRGRVVRYALRKAFTRQMPEQPSSARSLPVRDVVGAFARASRIYRHWRRANDVRPRAGGIRP